MSRWVYLLGVGMALVALAFVVTDALLWEPGVTEVNCRRLQPGMAVEEVEAILGRLPRPLRPVHGLGGTLMNREGVFVPQPQVGWAGEWQGQDRIVSITFGLDRKVLGTLFVPVARKSHPSSLARLRAWLGW